VSAPRGSTRGANATPLADDVLMKAAKHKARGVRVHVQRILSERAKLTPAQHDLAVAGLKDADPHVQRAAADALGQHPARRNVEPLLALHRKVPAEDTHLLHVLRMALRNQLRDEATLIDFVGEKWERDEPEPHLLAEALLGVSSRFAAAFLMMHLEIYGERNGTLLSCVHHIARHGTPQAREKLLCFVRHHERDNLGQQAALFHEVEHGLQESKTPLPDEARTWAVDLTGRLLASKHSTDVEAGIKLAGDLRLKDQQKRLAEVARRRDAPEGQRRAALDALARIDLRQHTSVLTGILGDGQAPVALREQSAKLLAQANQPQTRAELLKILPNVPARLQTSIAVGLSASPAGAEKLLDAVKNGKASARLLQDPAVKPRLEATRLPRLKERLEQLTAGLPPAGKEVQELLKRRREGFQRAKKNAALGAQVFSKSCANCHQVAGQGARIGPQLDGVGVRGLERLLEDVLDPNRNVDQAFRQTTLTLKKGQVLTGLLLKEEGAVLVLADSQGKEARVAKDEVEERGTSQVSPMPGNFAEQIPERDFNNLLAYLLTLQSKPAQPTTNKSPR
ncbi:MAG TPA: c-type cytochrome, partial [Gemmataceae bacterium]|nr:c-type cytochrome [Gemmataceae bacterium]